MIKGLESTHWKEALRKLSLFCLEKAQRDLTTLLQYLNGGYREDRGFLFTNRTDNEKTRGYRYKLLQARFHLNPERFGGGVFLVWFSSRFLGVF